MHSFFNDRNYIADNLDADLEDRKLSSRKESMVKRSPAKSQNTKNGSGKVCFLNSYLSPRVHLYVFLVGPELGFSATATVISQCVS